MLRPLIIFNKRFSGNVLSLRFAFYLLMGSLMAGTVGFWALEDYTLIQAFYMSVITISTVGFGEVEPLSPSGRLFVSILILVNIGIFAYLLSSFSFYVVEGEFFKKLFLTYMKGKISEMEDHIIICGYGRHGKEAANHFMAHQIPFVIIDHDEDVIGKLRERHPDILYLNASATEDEVLLEAGIQRARALISTLPDDSETVYVILSARELNPDITIIGRAIRERTAHKLELAGADHVLQPEQIGGFYMATLISSPHAVELFNFISNDQRDIGLEELEFEKIPTGWQGKTIRDLKIRKNTGAIIIGVRKTDGEYTINPGPEQQIHDGYALMVLGTDEQIMAFRSFVSSENSLP